MCRRPCGSTETRTTGSSFPPARGTWTSFGWKERGQVSLKTKLLLLVALSIAGSVAAVTWLIEARTHQTFREIEQERTAVLVRQFRHELEHEGEEITSGVETVAADGAM